MSINITFFAIFVSSIIPTTLFASGNNEVMTRSIRIHVVNENNEPLSNILIYYLLESEHALGPLGDPSETKVKIFEEKYTDEDGSIIINEKQIQMKRNEILTNEIIYINLEVPKDKWNYLIKDEGGYFRLPTWISSNSEKSLLVNKNTKYNGLISIGSISGGSGTPEPDKVFITEMRKIASFISLGKIEVVSCILPKK